MSFVTKPKQILVTGGAGFIGSNIVRILRERYPETRLRVLHLPKENLINLSGLDGIELVAGDILNQADVQQAVKGCDVVFHLAAIYAFWLPDMSLMYRVNVEGSRLVLDESLKQGVKRVVYTSSAVCYTGQGLDVVSTENSPFSMTFQEYAASKYDSHKVAEEYAQKGLDVVIACPALPLGPGDVGPTPTGRMITDIFSLPVPIAPKSEINIIDVRDCAMGHVLALERGRSGESYILGGENYTYADMLRRVLRICAIKRPIIKLPATILMPVSRCMLLAANFTRKPPFLTPVEVKASKVGVICNASKARRELGLTVRPLEETLHDALAWFVTNEYIDDPTVKRRFAQEVLEGQSHAVFEKDSS